MLKIEQLLIIKTKTNLEQKPKIFNSSYYYELPTFTV